MYNVVILEDDPYQSNYLKNILSHYRLDMTIQEYTNDESFFDHLSSFPDYSIFLMDIVLPHHDGIELAKKINETIKGSVIIFITGYIQKAADIYDANHCYFIYKPDLEKRLPIALDKAMNEIKLFKQSLLIRVQGNTIILSLNDIIYFERHLRKTVIYLTYKKIETYESFSSLQPKLTTHFLECHRSFIINLDKVKEYHRDHFIMCNDMNIPISRSHEKKTKQDFQKYLVSKI